MTFGDYMKPCTTGHLCATSLATETEGEYGLKFTTAFTTIAIGYLLLGVVNNAHVERTGRTTVLSQAAVGICRDVVK